MFKQPEPEGAQNAQGDRAKRGLAKPSQRSPVKEISMQTSRHANIQNKNKKKSIHWAAPH
jgi:hypothetical protein